MSADDRVHVDFHPQLTLAGELLLEAEQALQRTVTPNAVVGDMVKRSAGYDASHANALAALATAQFVHRGVLALERLAEAQRRTAVGVERLVEIEQRMLDADTRDKGPTT